jgi:hypothetical protein
VRDEVDPSRKEVFGIRMEGDGRPYHTEALGVLAVKWRARPTAGDGFGGDGGFFRGGYVLRLRNPRFGPREEIRIVGGYLCPSAAAGDCGGRCWRMESAVLELGAKELACCGSRSLELGEAYFGGDWKGRNPAGA